ncbi:hypothetical protein B0T22DRAFT_127412 [Podospora appendiculata]|uniref:Uncharacterized protein n=1 Tax=Podospora appendiculata TaxID=314037 RepID=A0AAE1CBF8_9PEZI|nr:hypothetical protein B0T22DRAFT_127412 [Podospora appendiculata]
MARLHLLAALALAPYAAVTALHNHHVDVHVISSVLVARDNHAATTTAPPACQRLMGMYTQCNGDMPSFTTPPNADFTDCFCDFHDGLPKYYTFMDALIDSCSPWAATAAPSVYDFTSDFMTICDHTVAKPPSGPTWSWADDDDETSTVQPTIINSVNSSSSISTTTSTPSTDSTTPSNTTDGTPTPTATNIISSSSSSKSSTSAPTTTQTQTALAAQAIRRPGRISVCVANALVLLAAALA